MEFVDRILKCADCGAEFVFSVGEQEFFQEKKFANDPRRCKECRAKRGQSGSRFRLETRVICAQCGMETTVPFKPTLGKPVLCRRCYDKSRRPTETPHEFDPQRKL